MNAEKSREDLETYLQDHYAAAIGALDLIEHLEKAHHDALGQFFQQLHDDVRADHEQLHNLMTALEIDPSGVRNAGAWMAEKFSRAKLGFAIGEDSTLRLLQALETLYIGITGKRLLWHALSVAGDASPLLQQTDFARLQDRAVEQADRVEAQRREVARRTFVPA